MSKHCSLQTNKSRVTTLLTFHLNTDNYQEKKYVGGEAGVLLTGRATDRQSLLLRQPGTSEWALLLVDREHRLTNSAHRDAYRLCQLQSDEDLHRLIPFESRPRTIQRKGKSIEDWRHYSKKRRDRVDWRKSIDSSPCGKVTDQLVQLLTNRCVRQDLCAPVEKASGCFKERAHLLTVFAKVLRDEWAVCFRLRESCTSSTSFPKLIRTRVTMNWSTWNAARCFLIWLLSLSLSRERERL